jgi:signal transduction histidine kinase
MPDRKLEQARVKIFADLGQGLSAARTPREAARIIAEAADRLFGWDACTFELTINDHHKVQNVFSADIIDGRRTEFPEGTEVAGPVIHKIISDGPQLILRQPGDNSTVDTTPFGDKQRLSASILGVPIRKENEVLGILTVQSYTVNAYTQEDLEALQAVADHCAGALDRLRAEEEILRLNAELEMRVQRRTAALNLSNAKLQASISERIRLEHELLEITERERRRIGLDLHDDLGQKLSGIALMTKGLQLKLAREQSNSAKDAAHIHQLVQETISHTSSLARDLTSLDLTEGDLQGALRSLALRVNRLFKIACSFNSEDSVPSLEPPIIGQIYKIAQEAVTNAIKHGKASEVVIHLAAKPDVLVLTVENNGRPFPDLIAHTTGMGLKIMNYRASLIGASLEVKGLGAKGTLVTCAIPAIGKKNS